MALTHGSMYAAVLESLVAQCLSSAQWNWFDPNIVASANFPPFATLRRLFIEHIRRVRHQDLGARGQKYSSAIAQPERHCKD